MFTFKLRSMPFVCLILGVLSCGDDAPKSTDNPVVGSGSETGNNTGTATLDPAGSEFPTDHTESSIVAYVRSNAFQNWTTQQSELVEGESAHRNLTKTYFNSLAAEAIGNSAATLPVGSALVKEMFSSDRQTVVGHATMVKVSPGGGEDSWLWYEGFLSSNSAVAYGQSVGICTGCHGLGNDYVRSTLPN